LQRAVPEKVVFVGIGGDFAGLLAVADPIKKSTPEAIEQLHRLGVRIIMLTGDNERSVRTMTLHVLSRSH